VQGPLLVQRRLPCRTCPARTSYPRLSTLLLVFRPPTYRDQVESALRSSLNGVGVAPVVRCWLLCSFYGFFLHAHCSKITKINVKVKKKGKKNIYPLCNPFRVNNLKTTKMHCKHKAPYQYSWSLTTVPNNYYFKEKSI
jgi:hypothetical protein